MTVIDSHAHLTFKQFSRDLPDVLKRAKEAGIAAIINVGCDLASSEAGVHLAHEHADIFAVVGVHPHDAKTLDASALDELKRLARSPKVVAIGEIGLDYYRDLSPRNVQRSVFETQLELASGFGLPVIVHDRDAHDDVFAILRDWHVSWTLDVRHSARGVLHSFSGDMTLAERALALGFYIGVSGPVTYKNAHRLREVVRSVPIERLLIETDAPYLTPHPHRGRRNEPAYVRLAAQAVAGVRGLTLEEVAAQTSANARALFGLAG
jgi:TatD DNase family protein